MLFHCSVLLVCVSVAWPAVALPGERLEDRIVQLEADLFRMEHNSLFVNNNNDHRLLDLEKAEPLVKPKVQQASTTKQQHTSKPAGVNNQQHQPHKRKQHIFAHTNKTRKLEETESGMTELKALHNAACPSLTTLRCQEHARKPNAHALKSALATAATAMTKVYAGLLEGATVGTSLSNEQARMFGEIWTLEKFQDILSPTEEDPLTRECTCSGTDLRAAHHPIYDWRYYRPMNSSDQSEANQKAVEQGWKIEVYLTCCVSHTQLDQLLKGLVLEATDEETGDKADHAICKCGVEAEGTSSGTAEVVVASSEAVVGSSEAVVGSSEAVVGSSEAVVGSSEAVVSSSEGVVASSESVVASSEAVVGSSEAVVGSSEGVVA